MYQRDFDYSNNIIAHKLSVVLMADSFFYSVFDVDGLLICHKSYTGIWFSDASSISPIASDPALKHRYAMVSVVIMSGDMHQADTYDMALFDTMPGLELDIHKIDKLPGQTIYNYYGINPHQQHLLVHLFGDNGFTVYSFPFLLAAYFVGLSQPMIHIHPNENTIFIYVQKDDKLHLYNAIDFKNGNDVLYFVMAAAKFAGIDPNGDTLYISGWLETNSTLYTQLDGYFQNIRLVQDVSFRLHPSAATTFRPHYYFVHFINILCGL
jgi:hypothetical protein